MHAEADEWASRYATDDEIKVLDIGGKDINGTPRRHFPNADYTVLDILDGPGVDIVADAAHWTPDRKYDLVVCCEVFEHTDAWPALIKTAYEAVKARGDVIFTMAGPGREPHSAFDGGQLHPDEYYGNIEPGELMDALKDAGFEKIEIDVNEVSHDVRAWARKK